MGVVFGVGGSWTQHMFLPGCVPEHSFWCDGCASFHYLADGLIAEDRRIGVPRATIRRGGAGGVG